MIACPSCGRDNVGVQTLAEKVESEILVDELFREIDAWIAAGMQRPQRRKHAKPAALAMAEASAIPLQ